MRAFAGRLAAVAVVAALTPGLVPDAHAAGFGPASILSVSPDAQFDVAGASVVSGDGRYVAFRGNVDGQAGLWRRDLSTGALDPVAVNLPLPKTINANADPAAPSVSADGRYIAFNTQAQLDPANDQNQNWDVYVRDMTVPSGSPGSYTLASAVDGGTSALAYVTNQPGIDGSRIAGSADLSATSPGGAITGDGRTVVFSVNTVSNLVDPAGATPSTPAGQVAVRNLDTNTTTLVSTKAYPSSAAGDPVSFVDVPGDPPTGAISGDDAVISADGSAVAWVSELGAIEQEAKTLPGEEIALNGAGGLADTEAVWRPVARGPRQSVCRDSRGRVCADLATRQVTGEIDAEAASCPSNPAPVVVDFRIPQGCAGPLGIAALAGGSAFSHLAMSGDGYKVVLLSPAPLVGSNNGQEVEGYLVDMHAGLSRIQATRALTQAVQFSSGAVPGEAPVTADAISADGGTVLLSTARTRFDLTSPTYIGPTRTGAADGNELYVIDLSKNTLDLLTRGYDDSAARYPNLCGGTLSPALSADGGLAVFDSCAANLVFGDGNGASDVFVSSRLAAPITAAPAQQPGILSPFVLVPAQVLRVTARTRPGGVLELDLVVPSAGTASGQAEASLPVVSLPLGTRRKTTRRSHGQATVARTVAASQARSSGGGALTLMLHLGRQYEAFARRPGGLGATVRVVFTGPAATRPLRESFAFRFHLPAPAVRKRSAVHKRSGAHHHSSVPHRRAVHRRHPRPARHR